MRDAAALPGSHNAQNAAAAAGVAMALGVDRASVAAGIASFAGLPHRQQRVATIDGIDFVNDSKGTNADATGWALSCYDRVVWIAGGVAKAGGIGSLVPLFDRVAAVLLIGRDAPLLAATLAAHGVAHKVVPSLDEAVPTAFAQAQRASVRTVLLSPACASFDQFSGFEARGERFAELVDALSTRRGTI
jgi:UDP-N-acetylmuramoylalanine--D-glutamate ligase